MTQPCPSCNGNGWSCGKQRLLSGRLVHRFRCRSCGSRWTIDETGATRRSTPPLTPEMVQEILTSDESERALAIRLERSTSLIGSVRRGEVYRDIHPELPRGRRPPKLRAEKRLSAKPARPEPSADMVLEILSSNEKREDIARRLGCTFAFVRQIRSGEICGDIHPELPRGLERTRLASINCKPPKQKPVKLTCVQCQHYQPDGHPCSLGLPDPVEEGLRFAAECATFLLSQED